LNRRFSGERDVTLTLTYKGFNYVDYYNGEYSDNDTLSDVEATGANSVALTPDWGIDLATSSIYAGGATTDSLADLTTAIDEANADGMTSFVRPLIDFLYPQESKTYPGNYYVPDSDSASNPSGYIASNLPAGATAVTVPVSAYDDGDTVNYRGELSPNDINLATFFGSPTMVGSYDYMIVSEARQAQAAGAKLFAVGVEMDSLANDTNPAVEADWDNLIADVRAVFTGKLTYSANWSTASQVTFWNKLDYVALDGYVPLSNVVPTTAAGNPTLASLIAGWNTPSSVKIAYSGGTTVSQQLGGLSAIDAFDKLAQQSIDKQFIFSELGYQNDTGAATDPTGGSATGVADPTLQAELYQAFFDAWGDAQATAAGNGGMVDNEPFSLAGAYFWDWNPNTSASGYDDWSPDGYPAEAVINANFATGPVVVAEKNSAGVGGYEGEPDAARGTAGTGGTGALAGDSDPSSSSLTITAISGGVVGTAFATKYGALTLNADGSYVYFPAHSAALQSAPTGAPPTDTISFTVTDGDGQTATSTLTIAVYRDPDVVPETVSLLAGATGSFTAGVSGTGALKGASDPDGATLSVGAIDDLSDPLSNPIAGHYGTLTLNTNGSFTYAADSQAALAADFVAADGAPLDDSFTLLVSGPDGTFTTTSLTVAVKPLHVIDDFNGDGTSDLLWGQSGAGAAVDETVVDGAVTASHAIGTIATGWTYAGSGDFNGDGTSDLLFEYKSGALVDWTLSNGAFGGQGSLGAVPSGFSLAGTGDFNGDGTSDLLLDDATTGAVEDEIIRGNAIASTNVIGAAASGWAIIGTGDFNGDGVTDILFQNSSSKTIEDWELANGKFLSAHNVGAPGAGWTYVADGDFNGDGTTDLLFKYANGALSTWQMQNGVAVASHNLLALPAGYSVIGTGDFTGNGVSDILIENAAGASEVGIISGGAIANWTPIGSAPAAGSKLIA
jgi:VCBS repeat-containing protein